MSRPTLKTRQGLKEALTTYQSRFGVECSFREQFLELLEHPDAFDRHHLPGHITGSAWIIDETKTFALLTHHAKLNRWLQPGGHADGDENIFRVAKKEAIEETGLQNLAPLLPSFFDIDIHLIPERNGMPQHLHFDVRFLFMASIQDTLTVTEESHALAWRKMDEIETDSSQNDSILRMIKKTQTLF